jgi:nicotinate-nucleotide adenylyltransferase
MRRLCFGGSFNPVHHAHLICARAVAEAGGFDRVVLIPSARPPHKGEEYEIAPAEDRLEMCRLAAAVEPSLFEVSDIELRRGGASYTIETVRALKGEGWPDVHWLIGADMLMQLPTWREPEALLREAEFVVMGRPGSTMAWGRLPEAYRALREKVVDAPLIQISATEIRERVAAGQSIEFMTPGVVGEYIRRSGLYLRGSGT